ncbi:hypothetical protein SKAU_G00256180 [Synaphobranchus kaupii]|uniref:Uncharacterized protein n=1 Tax=Synaphobranchus kaupii TaxID=118154 RepID=A0A9Q1F3T1_SYNKA|nr:hypothetical protein SKAU_G00256180 [Synaphobranchus kaupii]
MIDWMSQELFQSSSGWLEIACHVKASQITQAQPTPRIAVFPFACILEEPLPSRLPRHPCDDSRDEDRRSPGR